MTRTSSQLTGLIGRLGRAVADTVEECNYASRRMQELATAPLFDPDTAPDNYADFLYRTSGPLIHEPSALDRSRMTARRPGTLGTRRTRA